MSKPLVSIVIPLFNKSKTISRTINSILMQDFIDYEIIIVDDGSEDDGLLVIENNFLDHRIFTIKQENGGPGSARNHGLRLCKGVFVTFLDADDEWLSGYLSSAVNLLKENDKCAAFTSNFFRYPSGTDRWSEITRGGPVEGSWALSEKTNKDELATCIAAFHACTAMYRVSLLRNLGGFFDREGCKFGEDVFLWIQILLNYRIYRHVTPLAVYHTEDSDLGLTALNSNVPIEPIFEYYDEVRQKCPVQRAEVFDLWIARHAIDAIFIQLERDQVEKARWLFRRFSRIRSWKWEYAKISARLVAPRLWALAKRVRAGLRRI